MEIVAADIGGTHTRFALAKIAHGTVASLGEPCILKTAEYASFERAWDEFGRRLGRKLPGAAALAVAAPADDDVLKLTNNPWVIRKHLLRETLGLHQLIVVNDLGAVAYAVAHLGNDHFDHLSGPDKPLPNEGVISIIGVGTGLGVAQLVRRNGHIHVIETEGGHIDFAPLDPLEDLILVKLRARYRRVSAERIVSGTGLKNIYEALSFIEKRPLLFQDNKSLWSAALTGEDKLAAAALDRLCLSFGSVAGDIALAQGATGVVIGGGIGLRLKDHLPRSGFAERFVAKGRFERRMGDIPVKLITYVEAGLYGAAAAYTAIAD